MKSITPITQAAEIKLKTIYVGLADANGDPVETFIIEVDNGSKFVLPQPGETTDIDYDGRKYSGRVKSLSHNFQIGGASMPQQITLRIADVTVA